VSRGVYIIGAALIAAFVAMGATEFVRSQTPYCDTLQQAKAAPAGSVVRLIGSLVPGSASLTSGGDLYFSLKDKNGQTVRVTYKGVKPAGFDTAPRLLLRGTYGSAGFAADDIQTQCPSKYRDK